MFVKEGADELRLTTDAFGTVEDGASGHIPARFATLQVAGGQNVSVPYAWAGAPAGTRSFALKLVDMAPVAHRWVHWLVANIPASADALAEGASGTSAMPPEAIELINGYGRPGYGGPQPPAGTGLHPYVATLYALDVDRLGLTAMSSVAEFDRSLMGHVLAKATATGSFGG